MFRVYRGMRPVGAVWIVLASATILGCTRTPMPTVAAAHPLANTPRFGPSTYGTPHPFLLQGASQRFGWLAACQPREDRDGDGRIELSLGRHGDTFGDDPEPYFFAQPGSGEKIDRFLGADSSGRFAAMVKAGRRFVFDAATTTWLDLDRAAGTLSGDDLEPDAPRASAWVRRHVTLSADGHAFLIRSAPSGSELLSVEIVSGSVERLYTTTLPLWNVELSEDERAIRLLEITTDTDHNGVLELPQIVTNLAEGGCSGLPSSYSRFRTGGDTPTERLLERAVPKDSAPIKPDAERLTYARDCAPDGRAPIVTDGHGHFLLSSSSSSNDPGDPDYGPVEWTDSALVTCGRTAEPPLCRDDQAPSSFCDLSDGRAFGMQVWGLSEHDVFYVGDDLHHVDVDDYVDGSGGGFVALHGSAPDDVWALEPGRMVHYDGSTWTQLRSPLFDTVTGVFGVHPRRAWAFGHAGALLRFDGVGWRRARSPSSADLVTFFGTRSDRLWLATNRYEVFTGDGAKWSREASPEAANALDFWSDGRAVFAITSAGTLWKRLTSWRVEGAVLAPHAVYSNQLRDLAGRSATDLWISTRRGRLIHYDGKDFSTFDSGTNRDFQRIVAVSERDVFVYGGWTILRFRRK